MTAGERTWSVREVGEHVRTRVRREWSRSFWVAGEVTGLRRRGGRLFFDLVESVAGRPSAALAVHADEAASALVERRMAEAGHALEGDVTIRIRARLDWWVRSGRLVLALQDIDPAFTAGHLAMARRRLLQQLLVEGLVGANARRPLPRPPLRIGLVAGRDSAAYHDVVRTLAGSGWAFALEEVAVPVQGDAAEASLCGAVDRLDRRGVDVIAVVRGGGAEATLAAFNGEALCRTIATCRTPVWVGVGHAVDRPVVEDVAARAFATPTAVASALADEVASCWSAVDAVYDATVRTAASRAAAAHARVERSAERLVVRARGASAAADARVERAAERLASRARRTAAEAGARLRTTGARVRVAAGAGARGASARVDDHERALRRAGPGVLRRSHARVAYLEGRIDAHDPHRLLVRGWSVTRTADGDLVRGPVPAGTRLVTTTAGGAVRSVATDARKDA